MQQLADPKQSLPLEISPGPGDGRSLDDLLAWVATEKSALETSLLKHGALRFHGFDIPDAQAFERLALAISPDLKNQYLGTSPRNARSEFTFTASELPPHYPIMQHCEMSFLPSAPTRLFFACTMASGAAGETPMADCRAVWRGLAPAVRGRFAERGIRIIRNYGPPTGGSRLDPWQLKSWPEVFGTQDRAEVEATAAREGTRCEWREDGGLRLLREQPAMQRHPLTGEEVWFNHAQVFHSEAARFEYRHILRRQPSLRSLGVTALLESLTAAKRVLRRPDDFATHCTYADGSEIPVADIRHLIDVFWRHMVFPRWERGDVVVIDNFSTSHGRMPFHGPREILVAFTQGQVVAA
ncbi:MAG: TauD/TfdA family dioxygenase [Moraxellaceae bacterium]|nr:TauD/TfdA family dioxygenase [Moraxellaceae bacterium]